jgi:hypothetical protein
MLPNNQEDREVYLRSHNATMFLKMAKEARTNSVETVITTLHSFKGDPELLYVALDYARESGLDVTLVSTD